MTGLEPKPKPYCELLGLDNEPDSADPTDLEVPVYGAVEKATLTGRPAMVLPERR